MPAGRAKVSADGRRRGKKSCLIFSTIGSFNAGYRLRCSGRFNIRLSYQFTRTILTAGSCGGKHLPFAYVQVPTSSCRRSLKGSRSVSPRHLLFQALLEVLHASINFHVTTETNRVHKMKIVHGLYTDVDVYRQRKYAEENLFEISGTKTRRIRSLHGWRGMGA